MIKDHRLIYEAYANKDQLDQLDKKESYKDYPAGHNNEKAKAKIGPAIMHPRSIELQGGNIINIDKGVRLARQVNDNTVQLYTQKLGGGGIGGMSKVGVIKLTFNSPIVAINK
jgi:hypothetical protein